MSTITTGTTKVEEAQKPVKLTNTSLETIATTISVQADPSNVGTQCTIGDKNVNAKKTLGTTRGIVLYKAATQPTLVQVADPTQLWIDADTSKDAVLWTVVSG